MVSKRLIGMTAVALLSMAIPAVAQYSAGDLQAAVTLGVNQGNGANDEVEARHIDTSLSHLFRDHLAFLVRTSVYLPRGSRAGKDVGTWGAGLAAGLRWHFVDRRDFSLFADWSMGFVVMADPFPPPGTRFNGTPNFGFGTSVRVKEATCVVAGVRQLHISNGRGMVARNPSYDGFGGYVGLAWKPGEKTPVPPLGPEAPFGDDSRRWRVEADLEILDEDESPGLLAACDRMLCSSWGLHGQLALRVAELAGEETWDADVRLYRQTDAWRLALGYGRKEFNVFTSDFYELQVEHVLDDVSTIQFFAGRERRNLAADRAFGGLFVLAYPLDALALRSGIGFERQEDEFFESLDDLNDAGFGFGVEWKAPVLADAGLTAFLDVGIGYDVKIVGLRYHPGGARSVRDRHRTGGLLPLR